MNDLRIILIVIAILVIAIIYFWDKYHLQRRRRNNQGQVVSDPDLAELKIDAMDDEGEDYFVTVASLKNPPVESGGVVGGNISASSEGADITTKDSFEAPTEAPVLFPKGSALEDEGIVSGVAEDGYAEDRIITLHITVLPLQIIRGDMLLAATKQVDMKYGNMKLFHHFGVGEMQTEQPIFSLANMYEPGHFDLDNIESISTKGLSLFLRLPTAIDGHIVFELMLHTAQRLADILGCEIRNPAHTLLNERDISSMRNKITRQQAIKSF